MGPDPGAARARSAPGYLLPRLRCSFCRPLIRGCHLDSATILESVEIYADDPRRRSKGMAIKHPDIVSILFARSDTNTPVEVLVVIKAPCDLKRLCPAVLRADQ